MSVGDFLTSIMPDFNNPQNTAAWGALGNVLTAGTQPLQGYRGMGVKGMGKGAALLGLLGAGIGGGMAGAKAGQDLQAQELNNRMLGYKTNAIGNAFGAGNNQNPVFGSIGGVNPGMSQQQAGQQSQDNNNIDPSTTLEAQGWSLPTTKLKQANQIYNSGLNLIDPQYGKNANELNQQALDQMKTGTMYNTRTGQVAPMPNWLQTTQAQKFAEAKGAAQGGITDENGVKVPSTSILGQPPAFGSFSPQAGSTMSATPSPSPVSSQQFQAPGQGPSTGGSPMMPQGAMLPQAMNLPQGGNALNGAGGIAPASAINPTMIGNAGNPVGAGTSNILGQMTQSPSVNPNDPVAIAAAKALAEKQGEDKAENIVEAQKAYNVMMSNFPNISQRIQDMAQANQGSNFGPLNNEEGKGINTAYHSIMNDPTSVNNSILKQRAAQGAMPEISNALSQTGMKGNRFLESLINNFSNIDLTTGKDARAAQIQGLMKGYIQNMKSVSDQLSTYGMPAPLPPPVVANAVKYGVMSRDEAKQYLQQNHGFQ